MRGLILRLGIIAAVSVVVAALYLGVTFVQGAEVRQAHDAALQRYGDAALQRCQITGKAGAGSPPAGLKLAIFDAKNGTAFEPYNSALSATRQAKDASDLAAVLCMTENRAVFGTDTYSGTKSSTRYSCVRYERDLDAYLIDVKTGKVLRHMQFTGAEPPTCPDSTDSNLTRVGELPPTSDVLDWVS